MAYEKVREGERVSSLWWHCSSTAITKIANDDRIMGDLLIEILGPLRFSATQLTAYLASSTWPTKISTKRLHRHIDLSRHSNVLPRPAVKAQRDFFPANVLEIYENRVLFEALGELAGCFKSGISDLYEK